MKNEMSLEFDSKSENEAFARVVAAAFATQCNPNLEEIDDIKTVVSEAVTNAVVHAYQDSGKGKVYISVSLFSDRSVRMTVRDKGCGMAELEKCMQPLYTTDQSGERGGMGFAIMRCFSDDMKVKTAVGKGTTVTLIKKLT